MEAPKKISFSFSKSSKLVNISTFKSESKKGIELIECLEGQAIKIKNVVETEKSPLIIPLRDDAKNLFDRVKNSRIDKNTNIEEEKPDSALSLDELAARELIREATRQSSNSADDTKVYSLPVSVNKLPNQNDNESTIDDYNNVPVSDYGMAMLRGMGWTESTGIGKDNRQITNISEPELRPRGMGLGANRILNLNKTPIALDKDGQELCLTKGAFAKIIAGKHKGNYCEVLSLDDESGRIILKTAITQNIISVNEFLVTLVSKEEYFNNSQVPNEGQSEEYKKKNRNERTNEPNQVKSNKEEYKSHRRKFKSSSSSEEDSQSHSKTKNVHESHVLSSGDNRYKKRKDRSESPYEYSNKYNSKYERLSSPKDKRKSTKHEHEVTQSNSIERNISSKSRQMENSDETSDVDDYKSKKHSSHKSRGEERSRKKKSKKHKKHEDSSDEEYRKRKKSNKSKKHSRTNKYSSDEDNVRPKHKHKHSKNYR